MPGTRQPRKNSLDKRGPLEQFLELFDGRASVSNDAAQGVFVDWVIARYRDDSTAVRHHDMFALGRDLETGSPQSSNGSKMIDTR
jgi:hypothetical protein